MQKGGRKWRAIKLTFFHITNFLDLWFSGGKYQTQSSHDFRLGHPRDSSLLAPGGALSPYKAPTAQLEG